ncbi:linear amide C-N hydrolase [Xenorhabdus vietnamensis]|uniref:linear amide C-N hydrolase n=1 Tax=Xenorhabdus vietnamensis TaxID=351656 RepID=UPI003BB4F043
MNYADIKSTNSAPISLNGQEIKTTGQGSGLRGLPGDPTPESRLCVGTDFQPIG